MRCSSRLSRCIRPGQMWRKSGRVTRSDAASSSKRAVRAAGISTSVLNPPLRRRMRPSHSRRCESNARPARFIRCGEEFGQAAGSRLCVGQHEARAAVVVGSGEDLPDVPEIAQREIAAAPSRLEGAGVAARAQGPVVEECPDVGILAGCDAVGAACGAHREAVFAPAVALVAEVDTENRMPFGELLQVTAQQARGGCAVAEAFGRHEAVGGAAAQKGPQPAI